MSYNKRIVSANATFYFNTDPDSEPSYTPILKWDTTVSKLPWGIIILLGGGFALADASSVSLPCYFTILYLFMSVCLPVGPSAQTNHRSIIYRLFLIRDNTHAANTIALSITGLEIILSIIDRD